MLIGTTLIELTDVNTGEVEVIEKRNMVTNAISDLLQLNPDGYLFDGSYKLSDDLLPICPNAIGGILLYGEPLEEDPAKYYAPESNPLIGYSSNNVNESADPMRGSMNLNESGILDGNKGYRFVFDFATSQANGTIASLGLTSKYGGQAPYGSTYVSDNFVRLLSMKEVSWSKPPAGASDMRAWQSIVSLDYGANTAYFAYVSAVNTVRVGKIHIGELRLVVSNGTYARNIVENIELKTSSFAPSIGSTSSATSYTAFLDGGDGFIWGFGHANNANGNSSGNASVLWIKISKADWSFTEGTWTIPKQLYAFGSRDTGEKVAGAYTYSIIHDGWLYCVAYDKKSIVAIELSNPSNVVSIAKYYSNDIYIPTAHNSYVSGTVFNKVGDVVYFAGGHIVDKSVNGVTYSTSDERPAALLHVPVPGLICGPYLFGFNVYNPNTSTFVLRRTIYLMTPYLATINNLETPVTKTADKTMKITYILREE